MSPRLGWLRSLRSLRSLASLGGLAGLAAVAVAAPLSAGPERISDARLARRAASDPAPVVAALGAPTPEWVAWTAPGIAAAADLCCFGRDWKVRRCSLAGRDSGWGSRNDGGAPTGPTELTLLVEVERGQVRTIRTTGPACPIDGAGRAVTWLDGVRPEAGLALFEAVARRGSRAHGDDPGDEAMAAIAQHLSPDADRRLAALAADRGLEAERREQALFWAGAARGRAGYELLDRVLASEPDAGLREKALFALSQNPEPEARPRLLRAAREDRDPEVRGEALFWLAEDAPDPARAAAWILQVIAADADEEVREKGVFALAQLEGGADHLLRLLRESDDVEIRRRALFWLGQSDDPRALPALEEILGTGSR